MPVSFRREDRKSITRRVQALPRRRRAARLPPAAARPISDPGQPEATGPTAPPSAAALRHRSRPRPGPALQPRRPWRLGSAGADALPILPGLPRDPGSLRRCRPPCRSPRAAGEAVAGGGACSAGQAEGKGRPQPGASRRVAGPSSGDPPSAGESAVRPDPSAGGPAVNPEPSVEGPVPLLPPLRPRRER